MVFEYGKPLKLKPQTQPTSGGGLVYGDAISIGPPKFSDGTNSGLIINRPSDDESIALKEWRQARDNPQLSQTSAGPGFLAFDNPAHESATMKEFRRKLKEKEDESFAGFEEDSAGSLILKSFQNAPERFRRGIYGGFRAGTPVTEGQLRKNAMDATRSGGVFSQDPKHARKNYQIAADFGFTPDVTGDQDPVDAFVGWLRTPEGKEETERSARETPIALKSQEWWDADTQELQDNFVKVKPRSGKYYAAGILDAGINMGPAVAATMITRNPSIGAAIMGTQVYGETFGEMLDRGYTREQSMNAAVYSAAIETLTERIPLGVLTKGNYRGFKKVFAAAGAEGIQEQVVEAMQIGYDVGILDEEMTAGDAMWRLIDAGIIGFGAGAGMGGVATAADALTTPAAKELSKEEKTLDSINDKILERQKQKETQEQLVELTGDNVPRETTERITGDPDEYGLSYGSPIQLPKAPERTDIIEPTEPSLPKRTREINPATDSLAEAVAKMGGISREEAEAQGLDPAEFGKLGADIRRTFTKGGETFDGMAERLAEMGYPVQNEEGQYDPNVLLERLDSELAGERVFSAQGVEADATQGQFESEQAAFEAARDETETTYPEALEAEGRIERVGEANAAIDYLAGVANAEPTDAQKAAGNYKKGHLKFNGLDISIENPRGSVRRGTDRGGRKWEQELTSHYGYIKGTIGKDKDHLDVFIGDQPLSKRVFVVNQAHADGTGFDEHKIMMAFNDQDAAETGYLANYNKDWKGMGDVIPMTTRQLKGWTKFGNTKQPAEVMYNPRRLLDVGDTIPDGNTTYEIQDAAGKTRQVADKSGNLYSESHVQTELDFFTATETEAPPATKFLGSKVGFATTGTLKTGKTKVNNHMDAAHVLAPIRKLGQETVMALVTDADGKILNVIRHSIGQTNAASVDPAILSGAIASIPGAKNVWFAHNHPSGFPSQSNADHKITDQLKASIVGTGIRSQGMIVVAPGSREGTFYDTRTLSTTEKEFEIPAARRKESVSVTERQFKKITPQLGAPITGPREAINRITKISNSREGMMLLDQRNHPVGWIPMTGSEMQSLKTFKPETGVGYILSVAHELNSNNIMPVAERRTSIDNMAKFTNATGMKMQDAFIYDTDGDLISLATTVDTFTTGKTFQQRNLYETEGINVLIAKEVAFQINSDLKGAPNVQVVAGIKDLPARVKMTLPRGDATALKNISGLFVPRQEGAEVYLIAENLKDGRHAYDVAMHEVVGHYGLRGVLGSNYSDVMSDVADSFPREVRTAASRNGLDINDAEQRLIAAEEFVAYSAQLVMAGNKVSTKQMNMLQRVVDLIRRVLERFNLVKRKYRPRDILALVRKARMYAANPTNQRSATPTGAVFSKVDGLLGFYSGLKDAVLNLKQEKGSSQQMLAAIKKQGGVKQEELEWTGLSDYLAARDTVTKQEILDFVEQNGIKVEEVTLGQGGEKVFIDNSPTREALMERVIGDREIHDLNSVNELREGLSLYQYDDGTWNIIDARSAAAPKFGKYTLPGGKNYREVLLTLPQGKVMDQIAKEMGFGGWSSSLTEEQQQKIIAAYEAQPVKATKYISGHFDQPNVLTHLRLKDRVDIDGKKILFIEEVQSDWHQEGRRSGYDLPDFSIDDLVAERADANGVFWVVGTKGGQFITNVVGVGTAKEALQETMFRIEKDRSRTALKDAVPNAPFKGNAWAELAMKRALRMAVDGGYDSIAWTTGDQQADRYDLRKHVESITHSRNGDGTYNIYVVDKSGREISDQIDISESEVESLLGKEVSKKIVERKGKVQNTRKEIRERGRGLEVFFKPMPVPKFRIEEQDLQWVAMISGNLELASVGKGVVDGKAGAKEYMDRHLAERYKDSGSWYIRFDSGSEMGTYVSMEDARNAMKQINRDYIDNPEANDPKVLSGLDLKVGGKGMRSFYDGTLRNVVSKVAKKLDKKTKIGATSIEDGIGVHSLEITDDMRFKMLGGQPLFHVNESEGRRKAIIDGDIYDTGFEITEGSKLSRGWNYMVFKAQDKLIDLLRIQQGVEAHTGVQLPENLDAYLQEELFHGKVKTRVEAYAKTHIEPLVADIHSSDYTWDDVEWYLYARHAPEANAHLATINEDPSYNSGMSNEEADTINQLLREKGDFSQLEAIADRVDAMTKINRRTAVAEGLESKETVDAWEAVYNHYVPLKGWQDGPVSTNFPRKGKGFDTGGKLNKQRLGRKTKAANILANIVAQYQATVVSGEKAQVGRTLLRMVEQHPNESLWTANIPETKRFLDRTTGLVRSGVDPTYKLRDNVLRVKVDGVDHHITFNPENEAALRIARSMKNLAAQEANFLLMGMLKLNRYLSAINTSFNPEFIVSNFARDLQTAAINLNATDANKVKLAVIRDVFKAHRGIRRHLGMFSFKGEGKPDPWREEFDDFRKAGAQVGWIDNYKDVQDLERTLLREMNSRDAGLVSMKTLLKVKDVIEGENQAIENAVRLSAYHHAKRLGLSKARAASLAKNLTVNFNRRGDAGVTMNALYLFYNASIQGAAILWKSAKNKKARRVMYGIVAFAAALEIMNRMVGGQDDDGEWRYDKIAPWVRERNMIIMLPEKYQPQDPENFDDYFITVPLPYGYNVLHTVGQKIGGMFDYVGLGNKRKLEPMSDAADILSSALGSFNPIGTGPTPLQTVLPTALTPLAQVSENTAWHGGPVVPPQNPWDPSPGPDSQQFFSSASKRVVAMAEFFNKLSGGTKARPGAVDISPETIELWEDFLTGGAGRFVSNMVELGVMAKEGAIDVRRVPFARRLVSKTDDREVRNAFYEHVEEISYAQDEMKMVKEQFARARTPKEKAEARDERDRVREVYKLELPLANVMKTINKQLKDLRIKRKAVNNSKLPEEGKEERVKLIERRMNQIMNKFNSQFNKRFDKEHDRSAEDKVFPFIEGTTKKEAVDNLNSAGMPDTAALVDQLPLRLPKKAKEAIEEATQ